MSKNAFYLKISLFFATIYYNIRFKKYQFVKGLATGVLATAATVAGAVFAVKKTIIDPEEEKAAFIEENRKKAARRRVAR